MPGATFKGARRRANELHEVRDMLAERVKTWTEEWKDEGRKQGAAKVLRRLLARRFGELPAWADARLGGASEAELETWADRVLDAARLEDVVGEQP